MRQSPSPTEGRVVRFLSTAPLASGLWSPAPPSDTGDSGTDKCHLLERKVESRDPYLTGNPPLKFLPEEGRQQINRHGIGIPVIPTSHTYSRSSGKTTSSADKGQVSCTKSSPALATLQLPRDLLTFLSLALSCFHCLNTCSLFTVPAR